ncbi:polyprenyl synthetase family protein [Clostridium intestinale]|uniref:Heptaprenyl diphosphate synthase n=1 Tax=Clostridium intestinale DSM 6191 TaxID=1121320 RepID=A0A1M6DDL0_9CLOT|nr:polyprenyl synthetase family protein [Clostridium intestinale]SHI71283.1 heptaprenyl diphosphate synthase [Clostridium intestinale DSM 6191]
MDKMWDSNIYIKNELEEVVKLMKKNAKCKDKFIEKSIIELIESGGKMLRPAFVIISSKWGESNEGKVRALASVVEMLHMATLVHDDIIDDAKVRRGTETIQSKYGKDYAVYIGDYLFCACFRLLASEGSLQSIKIDSKSMSRICLGEIEQLNSKFSEKLSVKNYLSRISGKTAELFSLSMYIGAAESNCSEKLCREFWNIGHNIGMAFQIIDDILDYTGTDESIKKSAMNDIKQGIFTLPFIIAFRNDKKKIEPYMKKETFDDKDVYEIIKLVRENKGVEKAKELALKYTNKAFKRINKLPDNEYKDILIEVIKGLLMRNY